MKTKLKSMRGTTDEMLGGHLDEYMWRERYGRGVNHIKVCINHSFSISGIISGTLSMIGDSCYIKCRLKETYTTHGSGDYDCLIGRGGFQQVHRRRQKAFRFYSVFLSHAQGNMSF